MNTTQQHTHDDQQLLTEKAAINSISKEQEPEQRQRRRNVRANFETVADYSDAEDSDIDVNAMKYHGNEIDDAGSLTSSMDVDMNNNADLNSYSQCQSDSEINNSSFHDSLATTTTQMDSVEQDWHDFEVPDTPLNASDSRNRIASAAEDADDDPFAGLPSPQSLSPFVIHDLNDTSYASNYQDMPFFSPLDTNATVNTASVNLSLLLNQDPLLFNAEAAAAESTSSTTTTTTTTTNAAILGRKRTRSQITHNNIGNLHNRYTNLNDGSIHNTTNNMPFADMSLHAARKRAKLREGYQATHNPNNDGVIYISDSQDDDQDEQPSSELAAAAAAPQSSSSALNNNDAHKTPEEEEEEKQVLLSSSSNENAAEGRNDHMRQNNNTASATAAADASANPTQTETRNGWQLPATLLNIFLKHGLIQYPNDVQQVIEWCVFGYEDIHVPNEIQLNNKDKRVSCGPMSGSSTAIAVALIHFVVGLFERNDIEKFVIPVAHRHNHNRNLNRNQSRKEQEQHQQQLQRRWQKPKDKPLVIYIGATHEAAQTVHKYIEQFIGSDLAVTSVLCIGGFVVSDNIRELKHKYPNIITGTEGRILDLLNRKELDVSCVRLLVSEVMEDEYTDVLEHPAIVANKKIRRVWITNHEMASMKNKNQKAFTLRKRRRSRRRGLGQRRENEDELEDGEHRDDADIDDGFEFINDCNDRRFQKPLCMSDSADSDLSSSDDSDADDDDDSDSDSDAADVSLSVSVSVSPAGNGVHKNGNRKGNDDDDIDIADTNADSLQITVRNDITAEQTQSREEEESPQQKQQRQSNSNSNARIVTMARAQSALFDAIPTANANTNTNANPNQMMTASPAMQGTNHNGHTRGEAGNSNHNNNNSLSDTQRSIAAGARDRSSVMDQLAFAQNVKHWCIRSPYENITRVSETLVDICRKYDAQKIHIFLQTNQDVFEANGMLCAIWPQIINKKKHHNNNNSKNKEQTPPPQRLIFYLGAKIANQEKRDYVRKKAMSPLSANCILISTYLLEKNVTMQPTVVVNGPHSLQDCYPRYHLRMSRLNIKEQCNVITLVHKELSESKSESVSHLTQIQQEYNIKINPFHF